MEYTLKDKLSATEISVADLIEKSWQEIEHLQSQIDNLADIKENKKLIQLLKNLLTSYYVFVGGLENFGSSDYEPVEIEPVAEPLDDEPIITTNGPEELNHAEINTSIDVEFSEPFEYFIDFDEPVGEPLTDKDLYN